MVPVHFVRCHFLFCSPPLTHTIKLLNLPELPFVSPVYFSAGEANNCADENHANGAWAVKEAEGRCAV